MAANLRTARRKPPASATPASMASAVGYIRVSKEEQTEGMSLGVQEERIRAYCTLKGFELVRIYRDEGVSASIPLSERDDGAEMLSRIMSGGAGHVVGMKLDRMFRDVIDCLENVDAWQDCGVSLHLLDMGGSAVDTTSAAGRFMLTVLAAAAEMERNRIRERTRDVLAAKKAKGERLGRTPHGFTTPEPGAEMIPNLQELVAVQLILRGRRGRSPRSFRRIAAELNAAGHRTQTGRAWHPSRIREVWEGRSRYAQVLKDQGPGSSGLAPRLCA